MTTLEKATGPKDGVFWADAPEGATHYSLFKDHGEKWHKLECGQWSYYRGNGHWTAYSSSSQAYTASQVAIPEKSSQELANEAFEAYTAAQANVRVSLTTAEEALQTMKDLGFVIRDGELFELPKPWKKGDVVRSLLGVSGIRRGGLYVLIADPDGDTIEFRDDNGEHRFRHEANYELALAV